MEDALKKDRLKTIRGDDSVKGGAGDAHSQDELPVDNPASDTSNGPSGGKQHIA